MTTPNLTPEDGWIEWNGGECPVDPDAMVEVRFRDGGEATAEEAKFWGTSGSHSNWDHSIPTEDDIIAYRLVKP